MAIDCKCKTCKHSLPPFIRCKMCADLSTKEMPFVLYEGE